MEDGRFGIKRDAGAIRLDALARVTDLIGPRTGASKTCKLIDASCSVLHNLAFRGEKGLFKEDGFLLFFASTDP